MAGTQTREIPALQKVIVSNNKVYWPQVKDVLKEENARQATFTEILADIELLKKQCGTLLWVGEDQDVPRATGYYEIVRKTEDDGSVKVSIKQTSKEKWCELSFENQLYLYDCAAKRAWPLAFDIGIGYSPKEDGNGAALIGGRDFDAAQVAFVKLDGAAQVANDATTAKSVKRQH